MQVRGDRAGATRPFPFSLKIFHVSEKLPDEGRYVVCHYTGGNWIDGGDQWGAEWVVAKFRSSTPFANNPVPYVWDYRQGTLWGLDVDYWFYIPNK